jgi:integrase
VFAVFAHEWFEGVRGELHPDTVRDYEWQITAHLLPFFDTMPLSAIGVQDADRYRQAKVREAEARRDAIDRGRPLRDAHGRRLRPLNAMSINKTIARLAQILEAAVEYELIDRNVARGKRRKLKQTKYRGTFLDGVEQIAALLDAVRDMETDRRRTAAPYRRPLLATLVFAGLRIDQALSLRWEQVSLPARTMRVGWVTGRSTCSPSWSTSCSTSRRARTPSRPRSCSAAGPGRRSPTRTSVSGCSPTRSPPPTPRSTARASRTCPSP